MITGELKSKVDRIWDTMWSGGISNPLSVIEQLTYLLFIKRLDELHTLKERKATRTGQPIEEPVFGPDQEELRWSRFKETAPEQMFETVRDGVFPFIKTLGSKGEVDGEGGSTYTHHMKDALFMMPTARVLSNVVDQLDAIEMGRPRTRRVISTSTCSARLPRQGRTVSFRTPRHIIELMGANDGADAAGRDLRSGVRHGGLPHRRVGVPEGPSQRPRSTRDAAARRRFNEGTFPRPTILIRRCFGSAA